jgi:tetratricopeptide (TPR) repeat protein
VALKFLPEQLDHGSDAVERFAREARVASSLNHPNICTIYDIGVHDERRFIVMELLDGESLRSRIHGQPMPVGKVVGIGSQLADALDAAHAKGVIHRDIKPANIFLTSRGQAKLLDFGVAKLGGERHDAHPADETRAAEDVLTQPGVAVGSVNYMSPEQARGQEVDGRSDLFSLGLVLYEMSTGRQAFAGQTTAVVFDALLNRTPADPGLLNPDMPVDLRRVILRALEKDPGMRFQTAADMLAELRRIQRDSTGATLAATAQADVVPPSLTAEPAAAVPARRFRWTSIGVPVAVAAMVVAFFAWNSTRTPAFTERDTIVVADFVNTTGDPVFDEALKQAVSVQFQQTPYVTLLADARVQRTLQLMQRGPDEAVAGDVARELCQRAGAKATVEGSIQPLGTSYVMALGVHNCETGEPLAQQQTQADSKEDVLRQIGVAVTALRQGLGESLASIERYDVPVTEATTASLEALRAYGQGLRARVTQGDEASIPFFEQAAERDPEFALAHAKLAVVHGNANRADEARAYAQAAYDLRDRVSEYERLYIEWLHASRVTSDQEAALNALVLMTTSYPRDFTARNNLGVYYSDQGETEQALEQYLTAVDIAPDEPLPMANAASVLLQLGRLEEAHDMAARSLAIRPSANVAMEHWLAAAREGGARAAEFERIATEIGTEERLREARSNLALWFGRLDEWAALLDEHRAQARAERDEALLRDAEAEELIFRALYQRGSHIDVLQSRLGEFMGTQFHAQGAMVLAVLGVVEPARAMLPALELEEDNPGVRVPLSVLRAFVRLADGAPDDAVTEMNALLSDLPEDPGLRIFRGMVRERAGDLDGAAADYEAVIGFRASPDAGPIVPLARLALGQIRAGQGDIDGAREQFDALLAQWADADTEFELKTIAEAERAKLGG